MEVGDEVVRAVLHFCAFTIPIGTRARIIEKATIHSMKFYNVKILEGKAQGEIMWWNGKYVELYKSKIVWEV